MSLADTRRQVPPLGLGPAARQFSAQSSPLIIGVALIGAVAGRIAVARWELADLVGPAAIVAVQPFTEWTIHVVLLHSRPHRVGRLTVDFLAAKKHRSHHLDPKDRRLVFIPLPDLLGVVLGAAALCLLAAPPQIGLSLLIAVYAVLLTYEWTHFLIHSTYRPRHALYRSIWRSHRNHHYRNEHYWFGITSTVADHVLHTFPDRSSVDVSPTARTLGIEEAA